MPTRWPSMFGLNQASQKVPWRASTGSHSRYGGGIEAPLDGTPRADDLIAIVSDAGLKFVGSCRIAYTPRKCITSFIRLVRRQHGASIWPRYNLERDSLVHERLVHILDPSFHSHTENMRLSHITRSRKWIEKDIGRVLPFDT